MLQSKITWGFYYTWEYNPDCSLKVVCLSFDGQLDAATVAPKQFERLLVRYDLMKALFQELDCDEFLGASVTHADSLEPGTDPQDEYKTFRFNKRGPQLLVRQLEERVPNSDPDRRRIRVPAPQ